MKSYRINSPTFVAACIVGGDIVLQTGPVLGWSVGQSFAALRDYCQKRGWVVEPLAELVRPTWFEIDGLVYELEWNEDVLSRIVLHEGGEDSRELRYDELPDLLKEQL
jgi:hypothetical protein